MRWEVSVQVALRLGLFLGREVAPVAVLREFFLVHVTGSLGPFNLAVIGTVARFVAIAAPVPATSTASLLLFDLFDDLIEFRDDPLLNALHFLTRPPEIEPPFRVAHQPSDLTERFFLQPLQVFEHQRPRRRIPHGNPFDALQQRLKRLQRGLHVERPLRSNRLEKEEARRIDDAVSINRIQLIEGFIKHPPLDEKPSIEQTEVRDQIRIATRLLQKRAVRRQQPR